MRKPWNGANLHGGYRGHPPFVSPEGKRIGVGGPVTPPASRYFSGPEAPTQVAAGRRAGGRHSFAETGRKVKL